MIKTIDDNFDKEKYNSFANNPMQSWEWGDARKETGINVIRLGEYSNNLLINVFQLTIHKLPFLNYKIGYIPRSSFPSKEVIDYLYNYAKQNNFLFIKLEPYENKEKNFSIDKRLISSENYLFPKWSMFLNLEKSEDELFKELKSKTRYNIRLAQKKEVIVKEMTNEKGFEIFAKLYFDTCKRQKFHGHDIKYHQTIFNRLKNNIAHILIAFYKDVPLAAYELFIFKDTLYYPYGGSSSMYRNFMGANLLMWEAIKFGKENNLKKFDMWGSLSPNYDPNDSWSGFTKFKEGYNAKFIEFAGSFDIVTNVFLYSLFNISFKIRNILLGIF